MILICRVSLQAQLDPRELPELPEIQEQLVELALPELQALLDLVRLSSWGIYLSYIVGIL
jgi:hypothetical protein